MTIGEHLELSVLTAPIASLDRRALSQAWYSALYGNGSKAPVEAAPAANATAHAGIVRVQPQPHATTAKRATFPVPPDKTQHRDGVRGGDIERRAPRSALARKIERTFLHPRAATSKATFSLDASHGRVQVLLRKSGTRMKLIAICAPRATREVATALAQVRYALAARGIALEAETRGDAAW